MKLTLNVLDEGTTVEFVPRTAVIAGFTGRDQAAVQHHIDELAAQGIRPPERVPEFYSVPIGDVRFDGVLEAGGDRTSGEVEIVLLVAGGRSYIAVGSDHTDREAERISILEGKRACQKVVSTDVVSRDHVEAHWDSLHLRSSVDGEASPYQHAPVATLRPIEDILAAFAQEGGEQHDGLVLFLGTVPLIGGEFRFAREFTCELVAGDGAVLLSHTYRITTTKEASHADRR